MSLSHSPPTPRVLAASLDAAISLDAEAASPLYCMWRRLECHVKACCCALTTTSKHRRHPLLCAQSCCMRSSGSSVRMRTRRRRRAPSMTMQPGAALRTAALLALAASLILQSSAADSAYHETRQQVALLPLRAWSCWIRCARTASRSSDTHSCSRSKRHILARRGAGPIAHPAADRQHEPGSQHPGARAGGLCSRAQRRRQPQPQPQPLAGSDCARADADPDPGPNADPDRDPNSDCDSDFNPDPDGRRPGGSDARPGQRPDARPGQCPDTFASLPVPACGDGRPGRVAAAGGGQCLGSRYLLLDPDGCCDRDFCICLLTRRNGALNRSLNVMKACISFWVPQQSQRLR